jgi:hypothetical protein
MPTTPVEPLREGETIEDVEQTIGMYQRGVIASDAPLTVTWTNLTAHAPGAVKSNYLLTSIRIETAYGHDRVTFWNRGACAGTLTMREFDGHLFVHNIIRQDAQINLHEWRAQ